MTGEIWVPLDSHPPVTSELNQELVSQITEVAHLRRRFGYRRIHGVLRPAYPGVNHKRIYRLYAAAHLAVRKRRKAKRPSAERRPRSTRCGAWIL
jgi:putative transposase